MFIYPFRLPFDHPFSGAFSRAEFGAPLPPVTDTLLVFLDGSDDDNNLKLDSYKKPLAENFVMSQAPCIEVNGVDNDGTTDIDHGAIVSSEGSATVAYDGTTLSFSTTGTFYNVTFSDGTHFACAEISGLYSFSDDGQHAITWSGVEEELRAGRQDTYFFNDVHGWYEIDGDSVKYPYPVDGYIEFHKGGIFNNSGTSFAPATSPVGTFNGVDNKIVLDSWPTGDVEIECTVVFFDKDTVTLSRFFGSYGDSAIRPYNATSYGYVVSSNGGFWVINTDDIENYIPYSYKLSINDNGDGSYLAKIYLNDVLKYSSNKDGILDHSQTGFNIGEWGGQEFSGIIRNFKLNGKLIPINEGSGYDIHDSLGNVVGTLSGDETFWDGPEIVSDEIIKQEAVKATPVFTDGNGHPMPMTQEEWEVNTEINTNKQDYLRTGIKTELAIYSDVQDTENDTKLLEWIAS